MIFPRKEIVDLVRKTYPAGTRVALISMDDPYTHLPEGTTGTVQFVDDCATVHVQWDNGSSLGVVYGEDHIKRI